MRDAGWYPFTVLWCVDYVEQARAVLEGVFAEAGKRAGGPGPRLDRVVEELAHGIGRALWRDIGRAAERAARPGGPLHDLARAGAGLAAKRPGFGLRIVAESEGAIALAALLRAMRTEPFAAEAGPFFEMLRERRPRRAAARRRPSSPPSPPTSTPAGAPARPDRRLVVHLPDARDEKRLAVPPYGLSYFELVRRAFAGRADDAPPPDPAALPRGRRRASPRPGTPGARAPRAELVPIGWPPRRRAAGQGPISQIQLLYRSDVGGRLKAILRRRAAASSAKARRHLRGAARCPRPTRPGSRSTSSAASSPTSRSPRRSSRSTSSSTRRPRPRPSPS